MKKFLVLFIVAQLITELILLLIAKIYNQEYPMMNNKGLLLFSIVYFFVMLGLIVTIDLIKRKGGEVV